MRSKGKTQNQQAWLKEVKRITRLINKINPPDFELIKTKIIPEQPKRVTKQSLKKLAEINLPKIRASIEEHVFPSQKLKLGEPIKKHKRIVKTEAQELGTGVRKKPYYSEKQKEEMRKRLSKARAQRKWTEADKERARQNLAKARKQRKWTDEDRERARKNLAKARAQRKWTDEDRERARKNLAKGRETMRKRMEEDEEYAKRIRETRLKNLEKAREAKASKRSPVAPKLPIPETPEQPLDKSKEPENTEDNQQEEAETYINPDEPYESDIMEDILSSILSGSNPKTAEYLMDILNEELEKDKVGTLERIKEQPDYIKDVAQRVAYDSGDGRELRDDALALYFLFTGKEAPYYVADELMSRALQDRGYIKRRKK